jgi:hypothetical protein
MDRSPEGRNREFRNVGFGAPRREAGTLEADIDEVFTDSLLQVEFVETNVGRLWF